MSQVNIGDYVTGKEYSLSEGSQVIGTFGVDAIVMHPGTGPNKINQAFINAWNKMSGVKLIDNVEAFIGKTWNYYPMISLVKREAKAQESNNKYVRLCSKCGQFDEYAAPSEKHDNKVMCYRCYIKY
jgi:hypothetical protein